MGWSAPPAKRAGAEQLSVIGQRLTETAVRIRQFTAEEAYRHQGYDRDQSNEERILDEAGAGFTGGYGLAPCDKFLKVLHLVPNAVWFHAATLSDHL